MADPTLRLTYDKLRIRVAEYLGIAPLSAGVAALPTDTHDLDLVGRLVNDGYRRFIGEDEKWTFLQVPYTLQFKPQLTGTITAKTSTTFTVGALAGTYADDYFNDWQVSLLDESTGERYSRTITDYTGSTGQFTTSAVPSAIAVNDTVEYAGPENVEGQAWRYYLPDDFYGLLKLPFTYDSTGPRITIRAVTEGEIREFRGGSEYSGTPICVSFRPINTTATSDGNRWEAIFWPTPSGEERVTAVYKRFPQALSASGDVSVAGFQHDQSILSAALAAAELYRNDRIGIHEQTYQASLTRSKRIDARSRPARNRPYGDDDGGYPRRTSDYARPSFYNDTPLD